MRLWARSIAGCSPVSVAEGPNMRNALPPLVVALAFLAGWQLLHGMAGADTISSPAETVAFLGRMMGTAHFWLDVSETGVAFLWALLLSMAFGIFLGVVLGL